MRAKYSFDPMTVMVAGVAFQETCRLLPADAGEETRRLVANRILGSASLGQRDPAEMRDDALRYIAS